MFVKRKKWKKDDRWYPSMETRGCWRTVFAWAHRSTSLHSLFCCFFSARHMAATSVIFEYHLTNVNDLKNVESSKVSNFARFFALVASSFFLPFFFLSSFSFSAWQRFIRFCYRFSRNQVVRKDKAYLKWTAVFAFRSLRREKSNRCKIVLADAIATEKHRCQSGCMSFLHGTCHALLPPPTNKPDTVLSLD